MAVVLLCLTQFIDVLGVTVVVTALPSMLAGLHAPPSAAALVVTGYAMVFGGVLMLGARLGDRFGHRRVLLGGLIVFAGGSLLAATAGSVAMLVTARCVQGAAGDALLLVVQVGIWLVAAGVGIAGLGIGLSSVAATAIGTDVPAELGSTAAGIINTAAQLGTALGIAAVLLLATVTAGRGWPLAGTPLGWLAAALLAAAGALAFRAGRSHAGDHERSAATMPAGPAAS